jgi:2-phospho-L-lactate guanylyltransferase
MGLNRGLDEARAAAMAEGIETLVTLHGDLPNLRAAEIADLIAGVADAAGVAIAPDRGGTGTNGLALRPPDVIAFRFGIGSFRAHRREAARAGVPFVVIDRPGLAFDLDTPDDLARWLELGDAA